MKVGRLPGRVAEVIQRWTMSRKTTKLHFVPNGEGALDLRLDDKLIGQMWVESEDGDELVLHLNPVQLVEISRRELRTLIEQALRGMQ